MIIVTSRGAQSFIAVKACLSRDLARDVAMAFTPRVREDYVLHDELTATFGQLFFRWYTIDMSDPAAWTISFSSSHKPKLLRFRGAPASFTPRTKADFELTLTEVVAPVCWRKLSLPTTSSDGYVS